MFKQLHNGGLSLRNKTAMATDTLCSLSLTFQFKTLALGDKVKPQRGRDLNSLCLNSVNYWIINGLINND